MSKTAEIRRLALVLLFGLAVAPPLQAQAYNVDVLYQPGSTVTLPWDINDAGVIVGSVGHSDGTQSGFIFKGGTFANFAGPAGAFQTNFTSITNSGLIFGYYYTADPNVDFTALPHSFVFDGAHYTTVDIGGLNGAAVRRASSDGRYLTGWHFTDEGYFGFAYDQSTGALVNFGAYSIAQGATIDGRVVGSARRDGLSITGFAYDFANGETTYPSIDGLNRPRFRDMSDTGSVAGFGGAGDQNVAFLLSENGELHTFSIAGATDTVGYGLNSSDVLVGWYNGVDGITRGFIASPATTAVPEPQSWALLMFGLVIIASRSRHRRQRIG